MPTKETNDTFTDNASDNAGLVTIEKLVYGGDGLARDERQVVFAPYVLPGETVRIGVTERKTQHSRGEIVEIVQPSPHRVTAPCPHFTHCGGCHYQHADYDYQVELKLGILRETLERVGKLAGPQMIPDRIGVVTGPPFGYRNRAQFHVEGQRIGYHEEGSRRVQAIEQCLIISPKLQDAFATLKRMLPDGRWPRFLQTIELFTNETEVQVNVLKASQPLAKRFFAWCAQEIPSLVPAAMTYRVGAYDFRVSHESFFQVNRFLVERLVEIVLNGAEGETALDLYSGVGLFSLPLSKRFAKVTAVETGVAASRDLQFNAETAGVTVHPVQTSVEEYLAANTGNVDFVVADPPRAGLGKRAVANLLQARPRLLSLVSCDPATLARDLAGLSGSYTVEAMTMVDLFPQTYHLETVVRLRAID